MNGKGLAPGGEHWPEGGCSLPPEAVLDVLSAPPIPPHPARSRPLSPGEASIGSKGNSKVGVLPVSSYGTFLRKSSVCRLWGALALLPRLLFWRNGGRKAERPGRHVPGQQRARTGHAKVPLGELGCRAMASGVRPQKDGPFTRFNDK